MCQWGYILALDFIAHALTISRVTRATTFYEPNV